MTIRKIFFLVIAVYLVQIHAFAQDEDIFGISEKAKNPKSESGVGNVFRNALEMFALEISTGAAYHQIGTDFYSQNPSLYPISQYQNFESSEFTLQDTLSLSSNDWIFPLLNGGVRINLFNLLTIGGGYGMEWGNLAPMRGSDHEFQFEGSTYQISKYYGTVGLVLFDAKRRQSILKWQYRKYSTNNLYMQSELRQRARANYPWRFILEGEFGKMNLKKAYDPALAASGAPYVPRLAVSEDPYVGVSLRMEYDFSEYAKLFLKGGAEFRKFTYAASDYSEFQNIDQNVYGLQAGLAIKIPGTKRCKIQGCGVVMKHLHDGIEYRGSSIFNLQNRKIGQWY
jgi:opacity protein-like surface antigen